jgi:hypothetical protein
LSRRLGRLWPVLVLADLAAVLLAVAVNVATATDLPELLQRYRPLAWPAVVALTATTTGLRLWQAALERRAQTPGGGVLIRGSGAVATRDVRQRGDNVAGRDLYELGPHIQVRQMVIGSGEAIAATPVLQPSVPPPGRATR